MNLTNVKAVPTPEARDHEMRQLSISKGEYLADGTMVTPSEIIALFLPMDSEGQFDHAYRQIRLSIRDSGETDPNTPPSVRTIQTESETHINVTAPMIASNLRTFILDAEIPDSSLAQAFGVVGLQIRNAGEAILRSMGALP